MSVERSITSLLARLILIVVAAVGFVSLLDGCGNRLWLGRTLGSKEIRWIWDGSALATPGEPAGFLAVGEIDLESAPAEARLFVAGDASYLVFVNERWLGANRFTEGQWDVFELDGLLRVGRNRIVVELRSESGAGGLLACLRLRPDEPCRLVTDDSWRLVGHADSVLDGTVAGVEDRPELLVWRPMPFGHWRPPTVATPRSSVPECFDLERPVRFKRSAVPTDGPHRTRRFWWQESVTGLVVVELAGRSAQQGTLLFGRVSKDPSARQQSLPLGSAAGQQVFRVIEPRTLRYLAVVGAPEAEGAFIYPRRPGCEGYEVARPRPEDVGLFGLPVPETAPTIADRE